MKKLVTLILLFSTITVFSQSIYKKGYIVDLKNDTIQGYVLITKQKELYNSVLFTKNKKDPPKTYSYAQIKAYGYGKSINYESLEVPLIRKNFLRDDKQKQHTFLEVISSSKFYTFYSIYTKGNKSYYMKTPINEVVPLVLSKKNVDKYKIKTGIYKLPNGEKLYMEEGAMIRAKDQKTYFYEKGVLYEVIKAYQNELRKEATSNSCELEEELKLVELSPSSISSFVDDLHKCMNEPNSFSNNRILLQVSLLGIASTHPFTRRLHRGYETGLLLEFRENTLSPNLSLNFGLSKTDVTKQIGEVISLDHNREVVKTKVLVEIDGRIATLKANYHFLEGKNIRPYAGLTYRSFRYHARSEDLNTRAFVGNEVNTKRAMGLSVGTDFYLLKYLQVRTEVSYVGAFEYQVGFGVSIY